MKKMVFSSYLIHYKVHYEAIATIKILSRILGVKGRPAWIYEA